MDQLAKSGHRDRLEADLLLIKNLGISTLRTAFHWEHYESIRSWAYFDLLFGTMARKDLSPIIGLLYHGSGPPTIDLLDPHFPEKLADFALQVAQRYPSITDYAQ